jgi:Protein of unknown function (DUF3593)
LFDIFKIAQHRPFTKQAHVTMTRPRPFVAATLWLVVSTERYACGFAPPKTMFQSQKMLSLDRPGWVRSTMTTTRLGMVQLPSMDPTDLWTIPSSSAAIWDNAAQTAMLSPHAGGGLLSSLASSTQWLSFSDQGQNLAGIFFQASLLPYLLFLYFLSFRANRIPNLSNYGFQFVLLFVLSTIPSGIISKSVYGLSLANTDWLHGGAELLLTVANILIVSWTCVSLLHISKRGLRTFASERPWLISDSCHVLKIDGRYWVSSKP